MGTGCVLATGYYDNLDVYGEFVEKVRPAFLPLNGLLCIHWILICGGFVNLRARRTSLSAGWGSISEQVSWRECVLTPSTLLGQMEAEARSTSSLWMLTSEALWLL